MIKNIFKKYKYDIIIWAFIIALALLLYKFKDWFDLFADRENFEAYISSFGIWAPIVVILFLIMEVVIAPIPGSIPALTSGFLFGPILGSVYAYIGNMIGTVIVFYLARTYGQRIAEKLFESQRLKKYQKAIDRHENWLLAVYFVPIFPLDIITAAFGLSAVRPRKFFTVLAIAYVLYVIAVAIFGDFLAELYFRF